MKHTAVMQSSSATTDAAAADDEDEGGNVDDKLLPMTENASHVCIFVILLLYCYY